VTARALEKKKRIDITIPKALKDFAAGFFGSPHGEDDCGRPGTLAACPGGIRGRSSDYSRVVGVIGEGPISGAHLKSMKFCEKKHEVEPLRIGGGPFGGLFAQKITWFRSADSSRFSRRSGSKIVRLTLARPFASAQEMQIFQFDDSKKRYSIRGCVGGRVPKR